MSITPSYADAPSDPPPFPVRRFTVEEYHRLAADGVLAADEPVELLAGWIVPKMIRNPPHDAVTELIAAALRERLPDGWRVRVQSAITTADSEPEPDLAVVRGAARDHLQRHPRGDEVALVVEVAESSLAKDRLKAKLYGKAGIACYWIVNLVDRRIEAYCRPQPDSPTGFAEQHVYAPDAAVPLILAGRTIAEIPAVECLP